jgi:flavin reductase ActVB
MDHDAPCGLNPPPCHDRDRFSSAGQVGGGFDNVIPTAVFWAGPWPALEPHGWPGGSSADLSAFREAMSRFVGGVTIVTAADNSGRPWGFTASAFAALSVSPPLVLVCLARDARCHNVFMATELFAVSVLRPQHQDVALRFASKRDDKFGGAEFETDEKGLARLSDALASLTCEIRERVTGGDHTIIIGHVIRATAGDGEPAVYFNRRFRTLAQADPCT